MFTTSLFKVPEIPERHVPEERKPVPVPKEVSPAKGISTALDTNKQTKKLFSFITCFLSCLECIYEFDVYVVLALHYLLSLFFALFYNVIYSA